MIEINWDTEEDRKRRRHKASTIHGWLVMWRGTLMGNENVRQRGRREMREARAMRAYYRQHSQAQAQAQAIGKSSGPFSIFRFGSFSSNRNAKPTMHRHKSSGSRHHRSASQFQPRWRSAPVQRRSSSANKRHHQSSHSHARREPTRQRSSHSHKSRPGTSRRPSARR
ncbi:hypothetical protein BJV78DRAFT_626378 [Lactifluus subvellereus]|nr:hypothetical protein BJV78DRAFT_626378 [Lactifluus subvellereus]